MTTHYARLIQQKVEQSVRERVALALRRSGYPFLQHIHVLLEGGDLDLRGKVPNFYLKQVAQTAVMKVSGVDAVRNELVVT